ncbi:MAG: tyrosine-type recombinase/integrase [Candidatus Hodarchaeota archaeon]
MIELELSNEEYMIQYLNDKKGKHTSSNMKRANAKKSISVFLSKYFQNKTLNNISKQDLMKFYNDLNKNSNYARVTKKTDFNEVKQFVLYFLNILDSKLLDIETEDEKKLLLIMKNQLKINSILNYLNNRNNFNWKGEHNENPNSNKDVIMTENEVKEILRYYRDYKSNKRYLMTRTLAETGMRRAELLNIDIEIQVNSHIEYLEDDLEKRMIRTKGKTGKKVYFISENLTKLLKRHLENRKKKNLETKAFFVSNRNKRCSLDYFNKSLKKTCEVLGINKRISPHTFRRTLNTLRFENECPERYLKILLNHKIKDINYDHYVNDEVKRRDFLEKYDLYNPYKFSKF